MRLSCNPRRTLAPSAADLWYIEPVMRVGIDVTELRPGSVGGVRTALLGLLNALLRHAPGIRVVPLAPAGPIDLPAGLPLRATGGPLRPLLWRRSRALARALREVDLFHSPVTAIPLLDGPVMTATVHELPFIANARLEGPWRAQTQLFWLTRAMGRCARMVVPTRATLRQVCLAHPAAGEIAEVVAHAAPAIVGGRGGAREHDCSLLFVGRLDRRKCVEAFLEGAKGVAGQIRLVGPQPERDRRRILKTARRLGIAERVLFLGPVSDEDLDRLYRRASVVSLVSLSEGFGFPVLEALGRGVPVVVVAGTGAAEVGGDVALVVPPTRPDRIAEALQRARDPGYRESIARRGPARVREFTPQRTASGYRELFRRALGD